MYLMKWAAKLARITGNDFSGLYVMLLPPSILVLKVLADWVNPRLDGKRDWTFLKRSAVKSTWSLVSPVFFNVVYLPLRLLVPVGFLGWLISLGIGLARLRGEGQSVTSNRLSDFSDRQVVSSFFFLFVALLGLWLGKKARSAWVHLWRTDYAPRTKSAWYQLFGITD